MALEGLDFEDAAEMLAFLDPTILSGEVKLHAWQVRFMIEFSKPSTSNNPFKALVRAANGSGKDRFVIAPCVVFMAMKYPYCQNVVTSSSGSQLDRQTDAYVRQICQSVNTKFGADIWDCKYRQHTNNATSSVINMFATDEPGKAEGWHPLIPNGQMGIYVSEAKSVEEAIFTALTRCTGFSKWMEVSSPGIPMGHFYDRCMNGEQYGWKHFHVTAFDCPHLSRDYIKEIAMIDGESSQLYRSMILAEFGAMEDDFVVISIDKINKLNQMNMTHVPAGHNTAGLDLAAGGDETVMAVRNGNTLIALEGFRMKDTASGIIHIENLLRKYDMNHIDAKVFCDAGGLGKPIIDQLRARGWNNTVYVYNQGEPFDKRAYVNMGANLWFKLKRLIEEFEINLGPGVKNDLFIKQLSNRFYKIATTSKFQLESKQQAKAKGHPSPDRADAVALCYYDYEPTYIQKSYRPQSTNDIIKGPNKKIIPAFTQAREISQRNNNIGSLGIHRQRSVKSGSSHLDFELKAINRKISNLCLQQSLKPTT